MPHAGLRNRLLTLVALGALLGLPVCAQTLATDSGNAVQQANAACFSCHAPAAIHKPPRAGLDLSTLGKLGHNPDPQGFSGSNHGKVACTQCHGQGYNDYPHVLDARDSRSDCAECHASKVMRIEQQFDASVHAARLKDKFSCSTCHDPHRDLIAHRLIDPRRIVAQDNRHCLDCHDSDPVFARFAPVEVDGGARKARPDIDRIHAWLPNTRLHWQAVRCVECHTPAGKTLSHEILAKDRAERQCVACHSTDSSLKTRLYRHLQKEEEERLGFANSIILSHAYVLGATRHPVLDSIVLGAFALVLLGVLAHAVGRVVACLWRRRKHDE